MEFAAQDPDAATKRRVAELEKELAELKSGLNVGASEFMPSWPVADADANNNVPSPDSTLSYDQYADQIVTSLLDSSGGPLLSSPPSPSPSLTSATSSSSSPSHFPPPSPGQFANSRGSGSVNVSLHPLASSPINRDASRPPNNPSPQHHYMKGSDVGDYSPTRDQPWISKEYEHDGVSGLGGGSGSGRGRPMHPQYSSSQRGGGSPHAHRNGHDGGEGHHRDYHHPNSRSPNAHHMNRRQYDNEETYAADGPSLQSSSRHDNGSPNRHHATSHRHSHLHPYQLQQQEQQQQQHQQQNNYDQHQYQQYAPAQDFDYRHASSNRGMNYNSVAGQAWSEQQWSEHTQQTNRYNSSSQYSPTFLYSANKRSSRGRPAPRNAHSTKSHRDSRHHNSHEPHQYLRNYLADTMDRRDTSQLSWMEKIFAIDLRNDKDWRNFKNVQKHLCAATQEELQVCFDLSLDRIMDMACDDKENHTLQEFIEKCDTVQLEQLFPIVFNECNLVNIMTHPRANHVVQRYIKRLPLTLLGKCMDVLTKDHRRLDKIACHTIGNNVYQTGIKLCDSENLDKICNAVLVDDIIIHMAKNQFGLCVIRCLFQNMITTPASDRLKERLLQSWNDLCFLKYGNLTAQFLLSTCMDNEDVERLDLFNAIRTMAKHPHGNHVVQRLCARIATSGTDEQRQAIISATSMYFVNLATSQYGAFVVESILKNFSSQLTVPLMNILCETNERPTNLCKVASKQYGTQFLQKCMCSFYPSFC